MNPKKLLIGLAVAMAASVGLYLLMNARCYQLIDKNPVRVLMHIRE